MIKKLILTTLLLLLCSTGWAYTETFYACQGGDGTLPETASCATAYDMADLNTAGNWDTDDADDGKIGLNDVVLIMPEGGTLTGTLVIQQSGSSGNPITFGMYGTGTRPVIESIIHNSQTYINLENLDIRDGLSIGTNWEVKNCEVKYWRSE